MTLIEHDWSWVGGRAIVFVAGGSNSQRYTPALTELIALPAARRIITDEHLSRTAEEDSPEDCTENYYKRLGAALSKGAVLVILPEEKFGEDYLSVQAWNSAILARHYGADAIVIAPNGLPVPLDSIRMEPIKYLRSFAEATKRWALVEWGYPSHSIPAEMEWARPQGNLDSFLGMISSRRIDWFFLLDLFVSSSRTILRGSAVGLVFWALMTLPRSPLSHQFGWKAASWWRYAEVLGATFVAGQVVSFSFPRCVRAYRRYAAWLARRRKRRMEKVERLAGPSQWQETKARKEWAERYRKVRDAIILALLGSATTLLIGYDVIAETVKWLFGGLTPEEWLGQMRHPTVWPEMLLMGWVLIWDEATLLIGIRIGLPVTRPASWRFFVIQVLGVILIDSGMLRYSGSELLGWSALLIAVTYVLWALWAHIIDPRSLE